MGVYLSIIFVLDACMILLYGPDKRAQGWKRHLITLFISITLLSNVIMTMLLCLQNKQIMGLLIMAMVFQCFAIFHTKASQAFVKSNGGFFILVTGPLLVVLLAIQLKIRADNAQMISGGLPVGLIAFGISFLSTTCVASSYYAFKVGRKARDSEE
ncbi:hypothetical protein JOC36_001499 [Weissella uvarum]|uniref:hypothetical protein n=1 Tax=Weissella uvarum TaxID=1479233 RepID=UPI0019618E9B|nr:hypothetical protein [Weissella uvarum]MBM7617906.1 hypothetical protein [Weissella uvarum]MCM0596097.1 hypothetical protein [Weissella uvarum]